MTSELQTKIEVKRQWRVLCNLHTATERIDRAFFGQADDDRLRGRFGGALMLDQSPRNLLKDGKRVTYTVKRGSKLYRATIEIIEP